MKVEDTQTSSFTDKPSISHDDREAQSIDGQGLAASFTGSRDVSREGEKDQKSDGFEKNGTVQERIKREFQDENEVKQDSQINLWEGEI